MSEIVGNIPAKQAIAGAIGTVYGKDGLSAYEIALKEGFVGTEKEWVDSLKGDPGYTPQRGVDYWTEEDKEEIKNFIKKENNAAADNIICEATGSTIILKDSSDRELQGLKIYGNTTESGSVGDSGNVTVKVMGKNIADLRKISAKDLKTASASAVLSNNYGTTLSATTGNSVTVTQSKWPNTTTPNSYNNGFVVFGFYCPLRVGDVVIVSFDYEITNNPLNTNNESFSLKLNNGYQSTGVFLRKPTLTVYVNSNTVSAANGWNWVEFRNCGTSGVISNFQVEYGKTATEYEPYQVQTLVVSTPNGLQTGEVLEVENANTLYTYKPNTNIFNDAGAEMSVEYVADTKAYIDNKFTELAATLTALTGV